MRQNQSEIWCLSILWRWYPPCPYIGIEQSSRSSKLAIGWFLTWVEEKQQTNQINMSGTIRSTNGDLLYVSREHLGSIMGIASSIALGVSINKYKAQSKEWMCVHLNVINLWLSTMFSEHTDRIPLSIYFTSCEMKQLNCRKFSLLDVAISSSDSVHFISTWNEPPKYWSIKELKISQTRAMSTHTHKSGK